MQRKRARERERAIAREREREPRKTYTMPRYVECIECKYIDIYVCIFIHSFFIIYI